MRAVFDLLQVDGGFLPVNAILCFDLPLMVLLLRAYLMSGVILG